MRKKAGELWTDFYDAISETNEQLAEQQSDEVGRWMKKDHPQERWDFRQVAENWLCFQKLDICMLKDWLPKPFLLPLQNSILFHDWSFFISNLSFAIQVEKLNPLVMQSAISKCRKFFVDL